MSTFQARAALDQLVGRPAFVSQAYAGQANGPNSEVTSGGMLADIRELASSGPVEAAEATAERGRILASAYGFDVPSSDKPFVFANGYALMQRRSRDGGVHFEAAHEIARSPGAVGSPQLLQKNGRAFVAWNTAAGFRLIPAGMPPVDGHR